MRRGNDLFAVLGALIVVAWLAIVVLALIRDEALIAAVAGFIVGVELVLVLDGARKRRAS